MDRLAGIFEAAERAEKLEMRRRGAFEELIPSYVSDIKRQFHAGNERLATLLTTAGYSRIPQCRDTATSVQLFYRKPTPMYTIEVGVNTETLVVLESDQRIAVYKLQVSSDGTKLEACLLDDTIVAEEDIIEDVLVRAHQKIRRSAKRV